MITAEKLDARFEEFVADTQTFSQYVWRLIEKRKIHNALFMDRTHENRDIYYSLKRNKLNNPSLEKVLSIAIGVGANMAEFQKMLQLSGKAFEPTNKTHFIYQEIIWSSDMSKMTIDDFNDIYAEIVGEHSYPLGTDYVSYK